MQKVIKTITIKTITTKEYEFTVDMIKKALNLPKETQLFVTVPGGGDWSYCDLNLEDHPLKGTLVIEQNETNTESNC